MSEEPPPLGEQLGELTAGEPSSAALAKVAKTAASSARAAGVGAVTSGRWLAELALDMAAHIPVRDRATMEAQLGVSGAALADRLVRNASRVSAGFGAAAGALTGAEELLPPSWLLIPIELVVETLLVAGVEMKLLAELQELAGRPVTGTLSERSLLIARGWADQRGVRPTDLLEPGKIDIGRGARRELLRTLQRRLLRRFGISLGAAVPLMAGAAVGAHLNRRATLDFAEKVRRDVDL